MISLGLDAGDEALWPLVQELDPDVICGSASLLARWAAAGRIRSRATRSERLIFHAGEPLLPDVRKACAVSWGARIVDVYGMAEFDTVGSEGVRKQDGLILCPEFGYAICNPAGDLVVPSKGVQGELMIRRPSEPEWYASCDRVEVLGRSAKSEELWPGSWRIRHLGRADSSLQLPDGSLLYGATVQWVARETPGIEHVQVTLLRRTAKIALVRVLASTVSTSPGRASAAREVRRALLRRSAELADAVRHNAVRLQVSIVDSSKLARTRRGKVKPLVSSMV